MKILLFYTRNKGLLSDFFQELSEKLAEDGHQVYNFHLKSKKENYSLNGVNVYGNKRAGYFQNYNNIRKIIKLTKPDVILSNFSLVNPALLFGKFYGIKKNVVWFHTVYGHGKPNIFKVYIKSLFLKMAQLVIANSKILKEEMHSIYGVPENNTRCIPFWTNILNFRSFPNTSMYENKFPNAFKIGCPGRLLEDKNHQIIFKSINSLKNAGLENIQLFIAGDGPDKPKLEKKINTLGIQKEVIFLGPLSVQEMVSFYEQMDVLVLPSLNEAFGLVFIEAIALGRPVIVSSKFGALNFIDKDRFEINNFTFDPTSVDELNEKLTAHIVNKSLKGSYFENLYHETFDKAVIYNQIKYELLN
ncbi:glycosyltransferase family 4 protein [Subsaxibacter sp. CAU 1640]|uniref:glycosyltransferase family 4 protein n=1 Tax=Subsaxibacter sp. CAU 1640 TaxID=2933271 RepID=UPI002004C21D|nr:glycosyltransferase family 4 protein [Subsaxibacter sp. CAU 1640]MCK7589887.1 glycosyltransferase family 4 protein [Subsaxibacter sp. CAU 1640]